MDTIVSEKALRAFMERVFEKEGFAAPDARTIADVLMQADLFAIESHGAQRMMYYHQNIASGSVNVQAGLRADGRAFCHGPAQRCGGDAPGD